MNWLTLRRALIVSVVLFAACLTRKDFCVGGVQCGWSWLTLLFGPLGFLYAPLSALPWLANPLLGAAWAGCLAGSRRWCLVSSSAALVMAGSFLLQGSVVIDEGGEPRPITFVAFGYWLWLGSIMVVLLAAASQDRPATPGSAAA